MNTIKSLLYIMALFWGIATTAQTYARNGMVVSDNHIASTIGVELMKQGGNAIDASIATAFALAVTHPAAGNIGGGGFMVYLPNKGKATTIDFREKAPLAASPTMFLSDEGLLIPGSNHDSALSIGVPGTVAGMFLAHQRYGSLPWKQLLQPAINLARDGFPLTWALFEDSEQLRSNKKSSQFIKEYFLNDARQPVQFQDLWKQPALAKTLQQIANEGRDGFYKGDVAQEIVNFMHSQGGMITAQDLEKYEAIERKPIVTTFHDHTIYSMPPPSSGGVTMAAMLNLVELEPVENIAFNSTSYVHYMIEAMRRGFADRAEFLGDPDYNLSTPIDQLISKERAAQRRAALDRAKASVSDSTTYGHPYDGTNTTHFSIVDQDGNAVSVTYTLEQSYGSKLGSKALGFIFNNEMGDFNPVPGITNSSGQIGSNPNIIAPGKRMLSSMNPTIVTKADQLFLVIGSPGGRTIINTVFQAVLNSTLYNMNVKESIEAMKIHHQWLPDITYYEQHKLSPDTVAQLEQMGHRMIAVGQLGRLMGIQYDAAKNILSGAADSSSPDGAAVGF